MRILQAIPPASGAVVMGTGIVSIDLFLDGHPALSVALLVIAAIVWGGLGLLLGGRFLFDRRRFEREASSPAALTGVAGTAVLGTRLSFLGCSGPRSASWSSPPCCGWDCSGGCCAPG